MNWSNSSMTVLQREQVRSFLGGGAWLVVRGRRRVKRNAHFMAITVEIAQHGLINRYLSYLLFILLNEVTYLCTSIILENISIIKKTMNASDIFK